jgi:hypothetical protein
MHGGMPVRSERCSCILLERAELGALVGYVSRGVAVIHPLQRSTSVSRAPFRLASEDTEALIRDVLTSTLPTLFVALPISEDLNGGRIDSHTSSSV